MLEPPLHPMEQSRLENIRKNHARIHQLGIRFLASVVASPTVFSPKKSKNGGSGSDYDPDGEEDPSEGDISDDPLASDDNELQVVPLPTSSTPFHDISIMKVLLTPV